MARILALALLTMVPAACATHHALELREFVQVGEVVAASEPEPGEFLVAVAFTDGERAVYPLREGEGGSGRRVEPLSAWDGRLPDSRAEFEIVDGRGGAHPRPTRRNVGVRTLSSARRLSVSGDHWSVSIRAADGRELANAWLTDGDELDWSKSGTKSFAALIVPAVVVDVVTAPLQAIVVIWFVASGQSIG